MNRDSALGYMHEIRDRGSDGDKRIGIDIRLIDNGWLITYTAAGSDGNFTTEDPVVGLRKLLFEINRVYAALEAREPKVTFNRRAFAAY